MRTWGGTRALVLLCAVLGACLGCGDDSGAQDVAGDDGADVSTDVDVRDADADATMRLKLRTSGLLPTAPPGAPLSTTPRSHQKYPTIGDCAAVAVAGDTCLVFDGPTTSAFARRPRAGWRADHLPGCRHRHCSRVHLPIAATSASSASG